MVAGWARSQLVRLDDLYPGWDGLAAGSAAVPEILRTNRWRAWDWALDRPGDWHSLDPARPIVIEGVGAISADSMPYADYAIWVELDAPTRKLRALERDGDAYAPFWDRWAAQEDVHIAREHPAGRAALVVDGTNMLEQLPRWRALLDAARVDP